MHDPDSGQATLQERQGQKILAKAIYIVNDVDAMKSSS
jgi:hypothetical protein